MGYREALKRGMKYTESEVGDACVTILTEHEEYPLAFIEFETRDLMGIKTTRPDFTEGFVVLNKKYISSVSIVYQNDITIFEDDDNTDVSYT